MLSLLAPVEAKSVLGSLPDALVRVEEAKEDLMRAVRRLDSATEDLRYLSDPAWQKPSPYLRKWQPDDSVGDLLARMSAQRRFTDPDYRGQLH